MPARSNNSLWPKTPPALTAPQHAHRALLSTADRVRGSFDRFFEAYGITGQQYNVLRILRGAGPDGLPTLTIAERMIEQTPGITRMIDRLLAKGLVTRQPDAQDRRRVQVCLTLDGLRLLKELDETVVKQNRHIFRGLTPGETENLIALLTKLRDPLERQLEEERKQS